MIPELGRGSNRPGYTLGHATLHATKTAAHDRVRPWRGLAGWRTRVQERDVRSDGVRMIVWCATAWRKDST